MTSCCDRRERTVLVTLGMEDAWENRVSIKEALHRCRGCPPPFPAVPSVVGVELGSIRLHPIVRSKQCLLHHIGSDYVPHFLELLEIGLAAVHLLAKWVGVAEDGAPKEACWDAPDCGELGVEIGEGIDLVL